MKKLIQLFIILIFTFSLSKANEISTSMNFVQQPWDVQKYFIDFDCVISNDTIGFINGKCTIDVKQNIISENNSFFFRLEHLKIKKVQLNGEEISYTQKKDNQGMNYFEISLANATDDNFSVYIEYDGTPQMENFPQAWGGVQCKDSIFYNLGVGFYYKNVYMGSYWFPCYDHASDKAKYEIKIRTEKTATASGILKSVVNTDQTVNDGKDIVKEYTFKGDAPAATYMLAFAVGDFKTFSYPEAKVQNIIYSTNANLSTAKNGFRLLPKMIDCFEKYYGKYPFEQVGYVVTPTGSMEHQTMIALAKNAINNYDSVSYIVAHELAHSWFGGSITTLDFRDVWIKEAFATFSEALWVEYLYADNPEVSKNAYLQKLKVNKGFILGSDTSNKFAPVYNYNRDIVSNYPRIIYDKGALIIHMLRQELGDEMFFDMLKALNEKFKYSNITSDQLHKFIENHTKMNLNNFFNEWVYGSCYPILDITINRENYPDEKFCKLTLSTTQVQKESCTKFTKFKIDASCFGNNKDLLANLSIIFNHPDEIVTIDSVPFYKNIYFNLGRSSVSLYDVRNIKINSSNVIEQAIEVNKYNIYPSITSNEIRISGGNHNTKIKILNSIGQVVYSSDFTEVINVSKFIAGFYVIKINGQAFKFIKI